MSVGNTGALATLDNQMVVCSQVRIQLLCLVINWIYRMFPVVFWIFLKDRNWYLKVEYLICGKIPVRLKISSISNLLVSAYRYEKHCRKNFSVETGVTYTMLSSEITYENSSEKTDQKLHYIGIPVRANWSFVNDKRFTVYVSAGGAIEKCVYGKG